MDAECFIGSKLPWPWRSPLGDRMIMGDFCVPKTGKSKHFMDRQSNWYLAHHNLAALCWSINLANRVFRIEPTFAYHVARAAEAIDEVIKSQTEFALIRLRGIFEQLKNVQGYDSRDDDRDVFDVIEVE